jgi:hypothetical protein
MYLNTILRYDSMRKESGVPEREMSWFAGGRNCRRTARSLSRSSRQSGYRVTPPGLPYESAIAKTRP